MFERYTEPESPKMLTVRFAGDEIFSREVRTLTAESNVVKGTFELTATFDPGSTQVDELARFLFNQVHERPWPPSDDCTKADFIKRAQELVDSGWRKTGPPQ